MTTALHLCTKNDLETLLGLVTRRHAETGQDPDPDHLRAAITPLAEGGPSGAAYLLGPVRAPVGYALITFGWDMGTAGYGAQIVDLFIRPSVRRRGIGLEALFAISKALGAGGVARIDLRDLQDGTEMTRLAERAGFTAQPSGMTLSRIG